MKRFVFEITGDYESKIEFDNMEDIYVPSDPVLEYKPLEVIDILTKISSGFIILKKGEKGFIIVEAQRKKFDMTGTDYKNVIGCYYHEVHPIYAQAGIEELLEKTYENEETINITTTTYEKDIICNVTKHILFKNNNYVFLYSDDITKTTIKEKLNKELFNNQMFAIMETNSNKEVVRINQRFTELTGYTLEEINKIGFNNIIEEYKNFNQNIKSYSHCFMSFFNQKISICNAELGIRTKNGEHKWIQQNCNMIYSDERLIQTRLLDITQAKESEIKRQKLEKMINEVSEISKTGIIIADRESLQYTPEFYKIVEMTSEEYTNHFTKYVDEEDRISLIKGMKEITRENPSGILTFKYHTPNGDIKYLTFFVKDIYSEDGGKAYSYKMWETEFKKEEGFDTAVLILQDVTDTVLKEKKLEEHNLEKEVLLKEIHHRVKNNLQLISSFLNLEENFKTKDAQELLDITKSRVNSIALLHEKTYESEDFININIKNYIIEQFDSLVKNYSIKDINIIFDIDSNLISTLPKLTNLGLIFNELFTNTIKYAFDKNKENKENKEIIISIHEKNDSIKIIYKDNGKGLPDDFNMNKLNSLGIILITQLTKQLDGTVKVENDNGAKFTMFLKGD